MNAITHSFIREDIRKRIVAGEWALGEQMPGEVDFAREYDCARTTVNRALRTLADEGIVERRRKGGTRVCPIPVRQAQLRIPIIRTQVEAGGSKYGHQVEKQRISVPPAQVGTRLEIEPGQSAAYLETLHLADGRPFAFERRWVNLETVPSFETADLEQISANEWLVREVPFSRGEVSLSATAADQRLANMLSVEPGSALFTLSRVTWFEDRSVTAMELFHAPGYEMNLSV